MINNVVLVGRLTKDPDLRYTSSGAAVATFTLAVNRQFTNQSGEREADFINCVIWRKSAETLANYTKKGSLIGVEGRIQTRNYENQQGQRVYVTEVVANTFSLLEPKSTSGQRQQSSENNYQQDFHQQAAPNSSNQAQTPNFERSEDPFADGQKIDISDDDLPF